MNSITVSGVEISAWIYAPVVYLLWVFVLLLVKRIIYGRIKKLAGRTRTQVDDVLLHALNLPLVLLIFVGGFMVLERMAPGAEGSELARSVSLALKGVTIIAVILFLDRLLRGLIQLYSDRVEILRTSRAIVQIIVRAVILSLGLLILLDSFGISITPIVASLGIGSLAVALALQPTLENFFAGIQIVTDKPISVGQFIKLDTGEEGYVQKIGWRSSWVRMLHNNTVVIPNKILVTSKILNYYYPEKDMAIWIKVGVHYGSDLEHVEKVTIEVGEEIMKTVDGGIPDFKPVVRYHTFNDFSIDFNVILRCREFVDSYVIRHEFMKRLHRRYAAEGIVIPFPIRAVNYSQEKAEVE
jgi:small-conductance mechanosensitive channel